MHVLHPPTLSAPASSNATLLSLPKPSIPTSHDLTTRLPWRLLATTPTLSGGSAVACYQSEGFRSEEFPVDDSYLEEFAPKDKETEDEARRSNWIDRDWAPWEEILTPEGNFARKSLNEGEEVPLKTPEALEAFRMLSPKYRKQKMKELGLTEDEFYAKQFEIKGEIPEPLVTTWGKPMVVRLMPPRDWPPRGWDVDRKELEFIREAHKLMAVRVDFKEVEKSKTNTDDMCLDRYKVFLKQYKEWVAHNKERLEEESYKYDQDYHPGRRKRGKDYQEGMYELPFYYPGQICAGKVTTLHLYQGAFVDIGGVYEGWVPIKGNDWFWIRHHIKVGMSVTVEILAKRDPYRFRFPIEMRFVDPNIDHLIFRRFEYPPIFHHAADTNPDELLRDCGRPPIPRKRPINKVEEEPLRSDHPYVERLVLLHNAEQLILDDMEEHPEKYKGKKLSDLADDDDYSEENSVEYTEVLHKNKTPLPKVIMRVSVKDLDLEAALAERELHNKLKKEADERGECYKVSKLRRNIEMDEHDLIHWRRSYEEREALLRDISCRKALGLPLEEPRRYVDARILDKGKFDPTSPLYRQDYLGEIKNSDESRKQQIAEAHNKSIFGNGTLWYEMSLEDAIKPRMQREARSKAVTQETPSEKDEEDEYDDDNFDFTSIFHHAAIDLSNERVVNGTESPSMPDGSMFED